MANRADDISPVRVPLDDTVEVQDAASRRRFIRSGSAFLLATGTMTLGNARVLAADCDRAPSGGDGKTPKQAISGSDSDAGANADPAGCGRYRDDAPKISRSPAMDEADRPVVVARVQAGRSEPTI